MREEYHYLNMLSYIKSCQVIYNDISQLNLFNYKISKSDFIKILKYNRALIDKVHKILAKLGGNVHCHIFCDPHANIFDHKILAYFHKSC